MHCDIKEANLMIRKDDDFRSPEVVLIGPHVVNDPLNSKVRLFHWQYIYKYNIYIYVIYYI